MSIYTKISLYEGLPMSLAKKYTKKGKENAENMSPELKKIHHDIFGDKQRIVIGQFTSDTYSEKLHGMLSDIIKDIINSTKTDDEQSILKRILIRPSRIHPNNVNIYGSGFSTKLPPEIDKIVRRARVQSEDKNPEYSMKTLFKLIKKMISPDKVNAIQTKLNSYFTEVTKGASTTDVVLSRHPYDVGGMSTKQSWESCKEATCGMFREHLDDEVGEILIAYIVNPDRKGKDILNDAIARLLVLPVYEYDGGDLGMWVAKDVYPLPFPQEDKDIFHDVVFDFMSTFDFPVFQGDNNSEIVMYNNYYPDSSYAGRTSDDPRGVQTQEGRDAIIEQLSDDIDVKLSDSTLSNKDDLSMIFSRLTDIVSELLNDDYELDVSEYMPTDKMIETLDKVFTTIRSLAGDGTMGFATSDMDDIYFDLIDDDDIQSVLETSQSGDSHSIVTDIVMNTWAAEGIGNVYNFNAMLDNDIDIEEYLQALMSSYHYRLDDDDTMSYYIDFAVEDLWWLKKFGFDFSQWSASELNIADTYEHISGDDSDLEQLTDLYTTLMLPSSVEPDYDFGFDEIPDWDENEDEVVSRYNKLQSDNKESFKQSEREHNLKDADMVLNKIPDVEAAFRLSASGDKSTIGRLGFAVHRDEIDMYAKRAEANIVRWYSRVSPKLKMSVDDVIKQVDKVASDKIGKAGGEFDISGVSDKLRTIASKESELRKENPQQTIKFEHNKVFF